MCLLTMTDLRATSFNGVLLRTARDEDNEHLYQLFCSSNTDLKSIFTGLNDEQKDKILRLQFKARMDQYLNNYAQARFDLIIEKGKVIGNLFIAMEDNEIHLIDITLLTKQRHRGIGSTLLQDIFIEATHLQKPVTLQVQKQNPIINLYKNLGFIEDGNQDIYSQMSWHPATLKKSS